MLHDFIRAYYQTQIKVFETNYPVIKESRQKKAIHDLRVSCKRMNAIFFLMEYINPKKFRQKTASATFRRIFKMSGNIRELQLNQELILKYQKKLKIKFPLYLMYLEELEKKENNKFIQWLNTYQLPDWDRTKNRINNLIDKFNEDNLKNYGYQYVIEKINEITRLFKLIEDDVYFHEIRITLKRLRFVLEISDVFCPIRIEYKSFIQLLKETEQFLGDWHDRLIILSHFEAYHEKGGLQLFPPPEDFSMIKDLIETENKELLSNAQNNLIKITSQ